MGNIDEMLQAMEQKMSLLEQRLAKVESRFDNDFMDVEELPKGFLPRELALTGADMERMNRLISNSYIKVRKDGHLTWNSECDTQLAFVCGRIWAGDRKRGEQWRKGRYTFPAAALERLFGRKNLKEKRKKLFLRDLTDTECEIYDVMEGTDGE